MFILVYTPSVDDSGSSIDMVALLARTEANERKLKSLEDKCNNKEKK